LSQQNPPAPITTGVRQSFLLSTDFLIALAEKERPGVSKAAKEILTRLQQFANVRAIVIAQVSLEQLHKQFPTEAEAVLKILQDHGVRSTNDFRYSAEHPSDNATPIHELEVWISSKGNLTLVCFTHPDVYQRFIRTKGISIEILTESDISRLPLPRSVFRFLCKL
jgi:hypothetical protein